ncbi:amino acid adenylation domain-containing protein [Piscinibacter sp.]|uniref:amino acid adenylation domain-containing protein n=1 Tax=Piscinibacter sp. TaxID=1903157 RepID=UPI0039E51647
MSVLPSAIADLHALFEWRCKQSASDTAYALVHGDGECSASLGYAQLAHEVHALAARIAERSEPGDRVLLMLPTGLEWVCAFWACVSSGRIAVPVAEPRMAHGGSDVLGAIVDDAAPRLMLTPPDARLPARGERAWPERLDVALGVAGAPAAPGPTLAGAQLAYLQYTSGSTGTPRGVMISHANVLAQLRAALARSGMDERCRVLSWLPLFHDYGLVAGALMPFAAGGRCDLMPAHAFIRQPLAWWTAAARRGTTHSGGPHFAYAAVIKALAAAPDWHEDLSALRCLSCGAEPIRAETVEAVTRALARFGAGPGVFAPAYGLAEAVLGVSAPPLEPLRAPRLYTPPAEPGRRSVACGAPLPGFELRIVEPQTRQACAGDAVGEIWLRGASVAQGYWGRPQDSAAAFGACAADGSGPWLRSGDLGFLHDGELHIAGRLKDMLIVRGRNLYPQDLEHSAEAAHPACVAGGAVAFTHAALAGPDDEGEPLVLVQEVGPHGPAERPGIVAAIRRALADSHELGVHAVVLVARGRVPRTSSRKLRRSACRDAWAEGTLAALLDDRLAGAAPAATTFTPPRDPVEQGVWEIWRELLGHDRFGVHEHFFMLGGSSLTATQVAARLRTRSGVELPLATLFACPTVATLADAVRGTPRDAAGAAAIPPQPRAAAMPVTFSQQRMWLVQRMNPSTTAYNVPMVVRLRGALDHAALRAAVEALCMRHEAFRARFALHDGQLTQRFEPAAAAPWRELDLRPLAEAARADALHSALRAEAAFVFDLDGGALHRLLCVRTADDEHVLSWVAHHLIVDQWSAMVLWRELAELYNARREGRAAQLAPQRIDQADYAAWQRGAAGHAALARERDHWRARLHGMNPAPLPADRRLAPGAALGGARVVRALPPALLDTMARLAGSHGATPFMVMLAGLNAWLARLLRSDDIAVGTPVANRRHVDSENLVGTLVNTIVMRNGVRADARFDELLEQVRRNALEAFDHQDIAFDELVELLGSEHRRQDLPLGLQVLFNVQNAPLGHVALDGLAWAPLDVERGATQFPLSFAVDIELSRTITLEYADTMFDAATAERWLDQYLGLLQQLAAQPTRRLAECSLMSEADRSALARWNATAIEQRGPMLADERVLGGCAEVERSVLRDAASGRRCSGPELAERVEQIAAALQQRGVRRGDRVGLALPRGIDMVAAMLATWRCGAAYVPLDPTYPVSRLVDMASDAALRCLVATRFQHVLLRWHQGERLEVDTLPPLSELPAFTPPQRSPEDAAYLIYTSGSTGQPKGVLVPQRAVVNFLASMAVEPGLQSSDRLLAVTTLSFDIAVLELLLPLMQGAELVLASSEQALDAAALQALIHDHDITLLQATPSTWRMLLDAGWPGRRSLRALVGGEALAPDLARRLLPRVGELWNMYGPTETTVWSSCVRIDDAAAPVTIGAPIANTTIAVLDEAGHDCPAGIAGEIVIGGQGVALGYWRRPEISADRFVADPAAPGATRYRTGDLGRWRADGQLEHLGRLDGQVKLRGHRIELGEIEAALARIPAVTQAVACVHELQPGDARLAAYLVAHEPLPPPAELRDFLRLALPEYMLPQAYVALERLPLLPNGKVARQALPAPDFHAHAETRAASIDRPDTPAGRVVAQVWAELLGTADIGWDDNFFDLGGHSLLAARAAQEIERRLGQRVALRQLIFESLRQIAAGCERAASARLDEQVLDRH